MIHWPSDWQHRKHTPLILCCLHTSPVCSLGPCRGQLQARWGLWTQGREGSKWGWHPWMLGHLQELPQHTSLGQQQGVHSQSSHHSISCTLTSECGSLTVQLRAQLSNVGGIINSGTLQCALEIHYCCCDLLDTLQPHKYSTTWGPCRNQ
jgi:hypothetical protein